MDRRAFLTTAGILAGSLSNRGIAASRPGTESDTRRTIRAVAFDGFPIIDPTPLAVRLEAAFPGMGRTLFDVWRTRQFEYTWLRTLANNYADFWHTTQAALVYAARSLGLSLPEKVRDNLMQAYLELRAWPDVRPALERLRDGGIRMAFLSNFTAPMLDAALQNSRLQGFFEEHLTTDRVSVYKPHPRAYAMGVAAFGVSREEIAFCAAAAWDAAGAKWFGYPTYWLNRARQPSEELGVSPDAEGASMGDFAEYVLAR
jgi:2-haloacid dehalogenase